MNTNTGLELRLQAFLNSGSNVEGGKLHSPAPFSPEKQLPLPVRYQTGLAPEVEEHMMIETLISQASNPYPSHYIGCTFIIHSRMKYKTSALRSST